MEGLIYGNVLEWPDMALKLLRGKRSRMAERGNSAQGRKRSSPHGPKTPGKFPKRSSVKMNTDIIHSGLESPMNIGKGV